MPDTLTGYLRKWAVECPDKVWMEERSGDTFSRWTWKQARDEIHAVATWLENRFGAGGKVNIGILSRNRAHWVLADMAIAASGNVTIPMFTTLPNDTASYVMEFTGMSLLFVGEAENWADLQVILPDTVQLVALPGVTLDRKHLRWDDLLEDFEGRKPAYEPGSDDLTSIVFTSGTTGVPKGVMQTHASNILPIQRFLTAFQLGQNPQFLSYLPLSHIAERQLVEGASIIECGKIRFNANLATLLPDLVSTKPAFFFGPPRVWEQLQQMIIGAFGSQEELDRALTADREAVARQAGEMLGLNRARYLLTAAAPTPPALIEWFGELGIMLMEGFGQTEAMGLIANEKGARKIGSIGRPLEEVEIRISGQGELQVKAGGCSTGYYRQPEKTAETFVDGWIYTGDKAFVDDDGYVYLTGRVKDYFKTIQGKFVAPPPIEALFSDNLHTEQQCLLGRGYSRTVIVCVLSELARRQARDGIEQDLLKVVDRVNHSVEKHARIGALVISTEPWAIENSMLTPTLKLRRDQVEEVFGELARDLARAAAEQGRVLVHWH